MEHGRTNTGGAERRTVCEWRVGLRTVHHVQAGLCMATCADLHGGPTVTTTSCWHIECITAALLRTPAPELCAVLHTGAPAQVLAPRPSIKLGRWGWSQTSTFVLYFYLVYLSSALCYKLHAYIPRCTTRQADHV